MIDLTNKKILLVRNDNIGDLICTTPAIEALRKKYPNSQIDIVVNSYNYSAIDHNPFVDKIYCYTKPKHKKSLLDKLKAGWGKLKILLAIRREKYDAVVVFRSDYSKSAELFSNITTATYKVGVKNPKGKDHFNIHIPVDDTKHEVEFCFDCLKEFGVKYHDEKTLFYVPKSLSTKYSQFQGFILFHISSRKVENRYSKEKFKTIIANLQNDTILLSAEPADFAKAQWLSEHTKAVFIKTSSLEDLSGVIKNVALFVTLDGGAMHIAPALGVKTIAISGATNMKKWYPWGYKDLVIQDKSKIADNILPQTITEQIQRASEHIK
ncbi:glycosyltransferase family 9 protein [Sulfurospirillum sp. 1612]|uniref:glycosyltransferase family 9 protein n=1 Tax=Sulfurospirillum sp. 1612 TaxID=3094835 RepID=UPI002F920386